MSQWLTDNLHVKSLPKASMWEVTKKLVYMYEGTSFEVLSGYHTNLASIPRLLRFAFNVNGKNRRAAVLHDNLYDRRYGTRKECDAIFKSAMLDCGVHPLTAWLMWLGVRVGGWTRGVW